MKDQETENIREAALAQRKRPGQPTTVKMSSGGVGKLPENIPSGSVQLIVEATNIDGELAEWFDAHWWSEAIEVWADSQVLVQIEPTPNALLHPVTLQHIEMLRRVVPHWRIVGLGFRDDIATDDAVVTVAHSLYDEVRIEDADRRPRGQGDRMLHHRRIEDLFAAIRREQTRVGRTRPVLVRLPSSSRPQEDVLTADVESSASAPS